MTVYVLLDTEGRVYGVVTGAAEAEEWLTFDCSFRYAEGQLNEYCCFNLARVAAEDSEYEAQIRHECRPSIANLNQGFDPS